MIEKVGHVRNPLTIIAIFACLAEVSGTVVLPLMDPSVQGIFIWFLMLFPISLVSCFFILLWFKHEVLYAPSDFRSDASFERVYQSRTPLEKLSQDRLENLQQDSVQIEGESSSASSASSAEVDGEQNRSSTAVHRDGQSAEIDGIENASNSHLSEIKRKQASEDPELSLKGEALASSIALNLAAEEIGTVILKEITGVEFDRNVSFSEHGHIYDAISISSNKASVAEIRYFNPAGGKSFAPIVKKMIETLRRAYDELPDHLKPRFEGIALLMVDGSNIDRELSQGIRKAFEKYTRLIGLSNPMKLHIFTMERAIDGRREEEQHTFVN